ncbi:MAG TPA: hypothetical protein VJG30_01345 [Candidatus Nanoarchaeia archaeon]|nr:hypothetical protein [Candidatus Nanoarchaeia archaeon]
MNDATKRGKAWFLYSPLFDRKYELPASQRLANANCPLDSLPLIAMEFDRNKDESPSQSVKTTVYFCYDCHTNYDSIEPEALRREARRRAEMMKTKLIEGTAHLADLKRIVESAEESEIIERL